MKRKFNTVVLTFITVMALAAGIPGISEDAFANVTAVLEQADEAATDQVTATDQTTATDQATAADQTAATDQVTAADQTAATDQVTAADQTATADQASAAQDNHLKETEAALDANAADETETIEETETEANAFHYEHDPRLNPKAMEDAIVDPDAVYGFSPNPNSESLAPYLDYDWSDPKVVEEGRKDRIAYHDSIRGMYLMLEKMKKEELSVEEIARALSEERNNIRYQANADDPEKLDALKKSNLEKYGNEMGPQADDLYEKYGSWEAVIEKALSVNSGMDACLGLYDDYYDVYVAAGQIPDRRMYTVQPGDSLMKIAEEMNGDKETWKKIYDLNKSAIPDPSEIVAGQVLILP